MKPPQTINVLDQHGGFTAETKLPYKISTKGTARFNMKARREAYNDGRLDIGDTLWRPGNVLKNSTIGRLLDFDERSFYQTNNDVTKAIYRVKGYNHPIIAWFDNVTHHRIA